MHSPHILLTTLARNWWMVGVRGALAILFGLVLLWRPNLQLNLLVALFGAYAMLDGFWAIVSALWVSPRSFGAWPVLLEGAASLGIGLLAIGWPFVERNLVVALAVWGLLTGALEIIAARRLPRASGGYWLLFTGGVSSLFLALIIVALLHALQPRIVLILGVYSLLFGVLELAAARSLRNTLRPA